MKRKPKNKEAAHLQKKMELYESFLYRYLPQLSTLSTVTRIHLADIAGPYGVDRLSTQGTPFIIYHAIRKQRQHQLKKKLPLKPFSFSIAGLPGQKTFSKALELLQQDNMSSSTCKLESWSSPLGESIKKLGLQFRQQVGREKNLVFLDPLGFPSFSPAELNPLADKKAELLLFLPIKALWQLHCIPEKVLPSEELSTLKQSLDKLFPEDHLYWSEELSYPLFCRYLKEAFRLDGKFYTALEPAEEEPEEGALLALTADPYMMEKVLQSLQALRKAETVPAGEQLLLFGAPENKPAPALSHSGLVKELLAEEKDNRQLYEWGLQEGLLPSQVLLELHSLVESREVEVLDEKRKPLAAVPAGSIGYMAFKAPQALCYFRRTR